MTDPITVWKDHDWEPTSYSPMSPQESKFMLTFQTMSLAEREAAIQERIQERIKQEEDEEEKEYWAWLPHRYDPFDVVDHDPTESQFGIKKPLEHGGGYANFIKCEDKRLNEILSMKAKPPIP